MAFGGIRSRPSRRVFTKQCANQLLRFNRHLSPAVLRWKIHFMRLNHAENICVLIAVEGGGAAKQDIHDDARGPEINCRGVVTFEYLLSEASALMWLG